MNEQETMIYETFVVNTTIDRKAALQNIELAEQLNMPIAEKMKEYLEKHKYEILEKTAYITNERFDFYSPALEMTQSKLDIRNHDKFDVSNVVRCVICGLPLTHKKSISIAIGPVCSGLNYANEINWDRVIARLTTGTKPTYYKRRQPPKYYAFRNIDVKIIGKHKTKKEYLITIMGKPFLVPAFAMVYIPKMEYQLKSKKDENKRHSKANTIYVSKSNQETFLIKYEYIEYAEYRKKAEKLKAFLKLQRLINQ